MTGQILRQKRLSLSLSRRWESTWCIARRTRLRAVRTLSLSPAPGGTEVGGGGGMVGSANDAPLKFPRHGRSIAHEW